jgi:hypothetical protein
MRAAGRRLSCVILMEPSRIHPQMAPEGPRYMRPGWSGFKCEYANYSVTLHSTTQLLDMLCLM